MAFYEMLPGAGMPSGLQAGMDSVLNKKFGTFTTYPAEGWPDTVNLMGPLPEKTASGAIVTFPDGADAVPLKKCEITLPASLDGYSSVDVVATGKNLFNVADYSQIYTDRDGVDSYNYRYMIIHLKPNTTYTVSQNSGEAKSTPIVLINSVLPVGGSNYLDLRTASGSKTYTTGDDGYLYIGSVNSYDDVVYARLQECNIQIEAGSSATTYAPYTAPTTHTASLGRTIHGGTVDVVQGTAKPTNLLDETAFETYSNWRTDIVSSGSYPTGNANRGFELQVEIGVTYAVSFGMDSETYPTYLYLCRTNGVDSERLIYFSGANYSVNSGTFTAESGWTYYFRLGSTGTEANFDGQISKLTFEQVEKGTTVTPHSPYFAPFTFDPVPIDSKLGNNTIWSEQGSAEVTYRADINLALGGN